MIPVQDLSEVLEVAESLGLPKVGHFAYAVADMEATKQLYTEVFGVTWDSFTFDSPALDVSNNPVRCAGFASFCSLGDTSWEFVQPTTKGWPAANYLERHGEGLFHCGFRAHSASEVEAFRDAANSAGVDVEMFCATENLSVAYADPHLSSRVMLELVFSLPRERPGQP